MRVNKMLSLNNLTFVILFCLFVVTPAVVTPAAHSAERDAAEMPIIKFATYNIAMGLEQQGEMTRRLKSGTDKGLQKVAAIIQKVRPDVLLLNEFDADPASHQSTLFQKNYLSVSQFGEAPIHYAHRFTDRVNTGVDSGLDLDNNGSLHDPADAWGFGRFPYQYGMLVLSRYPINSSRTFQNFKWIDMPGAINPLNENGSPWYIEEIRLQLRLSSKSHWDIELKTPLGPVHFLVSHPTPPVFDGPEDRNGARNHDEIRFWADYIDPTNSHYIYDDQSHVGGLPPTSQFVIAGDLNADPVDGDSYKLAINQLLDNPLVNTDCTPTSEGGKQAAAEQAGKNLEHKGDPAADTGDFNDKYTGNMRIDYVLPSANLKIVDSGVFWPTSDLPSSDWVDVSDHRMVWVTVRKPPPE